MKRSVILTAGLVTCASLLTACPNNPPTPSVPASALGEPAILEGRFVNWEAGTSGLLFVAGIPGAVDANGNFKVELPNSGKIEPIPLTDELLVSSDIELSCQNSFKRSTPGAKGGMATLELDIKNVGKTAQLSPVPAFLINFDETINTRGTGVYYVDRDVHIEGEITCTSQLPKTQLTVKMSADFRKGWNLLYTSAISRQQKDGIEITADARTGDRLTDFVWNVQ
ncbi:hypothetical protein HNR42_001414 [Deinobacterium chartae]|uniref:Uncharacterized protein n=1 Tax=Deinobacterium chartae TaxID=521158 RepID=A0A841HWT7_9DEIO|nr:hypothetical protein [Deinobacterium chartae]MBB6097991.1 hypothetical protein [Deinobacterium chartae]